MSDLLEKYRNDVIKPFVIEVINDTTHRLGNNFLIYLDGLQSKQLEVAFKNPLGSPLGQQLEGIARAACGLMEDDLEGRNRGVTYESIQDLCEQLFAPPGLGSGGTIPESFWETPLGQMTNRAWLFVQQDEMITQTEAAEILGLSVAAIGEKIKRGELRVILDDTEPNPQRRRRVSRRQVDDLHELGID